MKKWLTRIALALLICLIVGGSALYFAPATWLAHWVQGLSNNRVLLTEAQGTVLNGQARLSLNTLSTSYPVPAPIRWQVDGWQLLQGAILIRFDSQALTRTLEVTGSVFHPSALHLNANQITLPIALLSGLGAPFNTLQLQGEMALRFDEWHLAPQAVNGHAVLTLSAVRSRLSPLPNLGDYVIRLDASAAEQMRFTVSTSKGPLFISGNGQMNDGRLQFTGQAYADPAQANQLRGLLNMLGRPDGDKILLKM